MEQQNFNKQTTVKQHSEEIISNNSYNDDRTLAFRVSRQPHKPDKIGWVVGAFFLFAFLVMSMGRLTIIGQFFDDVIFSFIFGWFKYFAYLFLFGVNLSILVGWKFKFKITFLLMVIFSWLILAWLVSTSYLVATKLVLWKEDLFLSTINDYLNNWQVNSVFGTTFVQAPMIKFAFWNYVPSFVNLNQTTGIVGAFLTGSFGYLSTPGSLLLGSFALFLDVVWVLTGNPFYLFLPKPKRQGKRLRLLALKRHNNPYGLTKKEVVKETSPTYSLTNPEPNNLEVKNSQAKDSLWDEITLMNENQDLHLEPNNSFNEDSTFELKNYDDELNQNFYEQSGEEQEAEPRTKKLFKTPEQVLAEQKAEFENLNPDEVRQKFAKEFSDIRPYGDIQEISEPSNDSLENQVVENFAPFKEASLDDTDFLNDLAGQTNLPELGNDFSTDDLIVVEDTQTVTSKTYHLPPISLLDDIKQDRHLFHENQDFALEKQKAIDETFSQFKVGAKVVNIIYGPAVIKFEIQPDHGTKVNSISALENDLKLALASQEMRIEAPIPGKNLVGIEIENKHRLLVGLKDLINDLRLKQLNNKLLFALGRDVENKAVIGDLAKMPHLLVAGSTGSGKSVMINTLIISLLMQAKPTEVKLLLIDPKKVELGIYSNVPHMLMPVISDMKQANQALKVVIAEMERRYELFAKYGSKNLDSFNKKQPELQLPYYVVIIDELADLMMTANRKEVEDSIMRITQMARAAGIHLVVATQRPSVDVVTGVIKANIPTRIAFSVATATDSRTILDSSGAEKLTGKGDMLYIPPGTSELVRNQGAYVSDNEIERVIDYITSQQRATYEKNFIHQVNRLGSNSENGFDHDPLYEDVKNFVIETQKASISLLQRKFNLGYNKAANLIDQLEAEGIVGQANGAKPREVLINN